MSWLLFPGRHLLNTTFQEKYLQTLCTGGVENIPGLVRGQVLPSSSLQGVIFAITSSNQANSRFNPIPFHLRAIGVDRFARAFVEKAGMHCRIFGIPHYGHTASFAEFTLKEIRDQSEGTLVLTPDTTWVLCSTPEVISLYRELGFSICTAEQTEGDVPTPISCIRDLGRMGEDWSGSQPLRNSLSPATLSLLEDYPEIPQRIARLYQDPLTNQEGSLTPTRNYNSYARGMNEIIRLKFEDIREAIRPGRIADEGCADGALLVEVAQAFPDADFYGIDLSAEFAHRFQERQRSGDFGGAYVHFYQRNLLHPLFEPESVDTVICNSTLHELWSYGDGEKTIRNYLREKWRQLRPVGRLLIRDVVGPEDAERQILMRCSRDDGENFPADELTSMDSREAGFMESLSTWSRFHLFVHDFLKNKPARRDEIVRYNLEDSDPGLLRLTLRLAMEFCSKKDYTDNWVSEMNEEFCFWSYSDWKKALAEAGFLVLEDPNHPRSNSRAYGNPWIIDHRYLGKVELIEISSLDAIPFPPTNMVLVAEKSQ